MDKSSNLIFSLNLSWFFCPFLYLTPPPIKAYIRLTWCLYKALYISPCHTCLKSKISVHALCTSLVKVCTGAIKRWYFDDTSLRSNFSGAVVEQGLRVGHLSMNAHTHAPLLLCTHVTLNPIGVGQLSWSVRPIRDVWYHLYTINARYIPLKSDTIKTLNPKFKTSTL